MHFQEQCRHIVIYLDLLEEPRKNLFTRRRGLIHRENQQHHFNKTRYTILTWGGFCGPICLNPPVVERRLAPWTTWKDSPQPQAGCAPAPPRGGWRRRRTPPQPRGSDVLGGGLCWGEERDTSKNETCPRAPVVPSYRRCLERI